MVLGSVKKTGDVDGRTIYTIHYRSIHIEHAYKGEIVNWLESGKFVYNEDLED